MRIRDPEWKNLDPGSGMEKKLDPGFGMEKVGSGINIPDPQYCYRSFRMRNIDNNLFNYFELRRIVFWTSSSSGRTRKSWKIS
jgi:hypothetical protein